MTFDLQSQRLMLWHALNDELEMHLKRDRDSHQATESLNALFSIEKFWAYQGMQVLLTIS